MISTFTIQPETCPQCGHRHGGEEVAFICIGCPCDERPPGPAPPKAKRKKSTSPTQRTLEECRKRKLPAQIVERWNPHARVRQDLFGVIDVVVLVPPVHFDNGTTMPGEIVGLQACAGASHAARRDKILAEPRARLWVEAGGRLELWSWSLRGDRGKAKRWKLRVEAFTVESWVDRNAPAQEARSA